MLLINRRLWVAASVALLVACAGGPAPAPRVAPAAPAAPVAPEVRNALAPTGTLRIGAYPGSPTSLVRGPGPQDMRGLTVEVGRELARRLGVPAASVVAAADMLRKGELDAFATNKGILFDMGDRIPGSRVLDGRWGLEQLAVGVPKGREAGAAYLKAFVADPATQALVQAAAQRAGLRGLAQP